MEEGMQYLFVPHILFLYLTSAARVLVTTPTQETAATKVTTIRKTPATTTEDASAS
jgi:hypothetical protein